MDEVMETYLEACDAVGELRRAFIPNHVEMDTYLQNQLSQYSGSDKSEFMWWLKHELAGDDHINCFLAWTLLA
jgi:hypothetical protein